MTAVDDQGADSQGRGEYIGVVDSEACARGDLVCVRRATHVSLGGISERLVRAASADLAGPGQRVGESKAGALSYWMEGCSQGLRAAIADRSDEIMSAVVSNVELVTPRQAVEDIATARVVRYGDRIADRWHEWEWRLRGSNLEDRLLGLALFGLCLAWIVAMTRVAQRSRRE